MCRCIGMGIFSFSSLADNTFLLSGLYSLYSGVLFRGMPGCYLVQLRLVPNAMNLESEAARSLLMRELMSQALEGPTTRLAKQPRDLAARELPPGNWSGLFVLYQAYCVASNERPASRTLFYQVSKEWRGALKFRPKSQHSTCQTCDKLKSEMRHAKSFMQHAVSADRLLGHLARTWKCREVYWAARQKSRAGDGLLTLICDGYDKSKPALPRWPRGRPPKGGVFERVNRTYLQISCVICHGYGCILYTAEESVSSGGSYSWECILNAIGHCWEAAAKRGQGLPRAFLPCNHDKLFSFVDSVDVFMRA